MMKLPILSLVLLVSAHAGEFVPANVAPEAKWWLHADLDAARESAMGEMMVTEIAARKGAKLRAMKRLFSVNPLTDLGSITLYGDGVDKRAVVMIKGEFDRGHLEDLVKAGDDYSSQEQSGMTVHSWNDKGKMQHAAFVADDFIVFCEVEEMLGKALTVLESGEGMAVDSFAGEGSGAPILIGAAKLSEIEMKGDESKLLKNADSLRIALAEAGGRMEGRMMLEVGDADEGTRFRHVLEGMVSLGELGDPALEAADIQFKVANGNGGKVVRASLSVPSSELTALMLERGVLDLLGEAE